MHLDLFLLAPLFKIASFVDYLCKMDSNHSTAEHPRKISSMVRDLKADYNDFMISSKFRKSCPFLIFGTMGFIRWPIKNVIVII